MNQYKYGKFTYQLDENNNYKVTSPIPEPETVYKYYSNSKFSKEAITEQYLFCSHPYHLNDSMDTSNLLWDLTNITKKIYNAFFKKTGLDKIIEISFEKDKKENFNLLRIHLFNFVTKGAGIISLTTEPLHTLMWSHYATEKGFMVELDYKEIKNGLGKYNKSLKNYAFLPIQYVEELESIDCFQEGFNSPDIPFLYSIGIKRKDWNYENEWRLIPFENNYGIPHSLILPQNDLKGDSERKLHYPKNAIKCIVLGKHFFNGKNIEQVIDNHIFKLKEDFDFINYLFENFNDRIFLCGEYEKEKKFARSAEQIEFEKIDSTTFKITREKDGFYQK
ncbi:MAG: DUF2971 domain-containing protein [Lutibacter sp.]|jgi:hypothetical protein